MKAYDLAVDVTHEPGQLAAATDALAEAGINVEGFAAWGEGPRGTLHILVTDPDTALAVLDHNGIRVRRVREALFAVVENRPGVIVEYARRLADQGVNIEAIYLAAGTRLVAVCDDVEKARHVWGEPIPAA